METRLKNGILITISSVAGIIFIFSGISKLWSLDSFELYVYSLNILNLSLTSMFARLLISIEIFTGILLFLPSFRQTAWYLSMTLLILFSVSLVLQLILKNTTDCHCFGDIIRLSPLVSLLKNILLILLLLPVKPWTQSRRPNFFVGSAIFLLILIVITVLFPTYILYKGSNARPAQFNYAAYQALYKEDSSKFITADSGPMMLCFFSPSCRYCQLSARKITILSKANSIPDGRILFIFRNNSGNLDDFFRTSESSRFQVRLIDTKSFFRITGGVTPLILLVAGSDVHASYGFRNLNEGEVATFLKYKQPE
jgi:hypothetical protein